jgi:hypothetical protein
VPRFEPGSLGRTTDALDTSATPPLELLIFMIQKMLQFVLKIVDIFYFFTAGKKAQKWTLTKFTKLSTI